MKILMRDREQNSGIDRLFSCGQPVSVFEQSGRPYKGLLSPLGKGLAGMKFAVPIFLESLKGARS
jgi:hypothetical protein